MTRLIFIEWLQAFDRHVGNRKVLLILDNCSAHIPLHQLSDYVLLRNTTVLYLPHNTTSKIQPCDAGIIRIFKAYYRNRFNRLLLQRIADNVNQPGGIDVLQAIQLAVPSWETDVKATTIRNCYKHCKIRTLEAGEEDDSIVTTALEEALMEDLRLQISRLCYMNPMDLKTFLNYPAEEVVTDVSSLDYPLLLDGRGERVGNENITVVTRSMAKEMLQSLDIFWGQQEGGNPEFFELCRRMRDMVDELSSQ